MNTTLNKVHCLFEQSGTFKKQFKQLGIPAEDYDIKNDFGETDHVIDLFSEIEKAYKDEPSIFDDISQNDLIIAFFPCIRFENQIMLWFRGQAKQQEKWSCEDKIIYDMNLMNELHTMYNYVNYLFLVCLKRNLRLIMENPYSKEHFLSRYWCCLPSVIDKDRRDKGDYFAKPTQYWFLNCEPKNNLIFEPVSYNYVGTGWNERTVDDWQKTGAKTCKVARSMIHPDYANRFIREYIL